MTLRERARTHVRFLRGDNEVAVLERPVGCDSTDGFMWDRTVETLAKLEALGIAGEREVLDAYVERLGDILVTICERAR